MPTPVSVTVTSRPAAAERRGDRRAHRELAPLGHGLDRVGDDVGEGALDEVAVEGDGAEALARLVADLHRAAGREGLEPEHGGHGGVEVDGLAAHLHAPEALVLVDAAAHAVELLREEAEEVAVLREGVAPGVLLLEKLRGAGGHGEGVLEVVGHLGGEAAEGGEAARPLALHRVALRRAPEGHRARDRAGGTHGDGDEFARLHGAGDHPRSARGFTAQWASRPAAQRVARASDDAAEAPPRALSWHGSW
jgi:hypothetical protein